MDRRQLLTGLSLVAALGVSIYGTAQYEVPAGRAPDGGHGQSANALSEDEMQFVSAVAESIIPTTDTPGAQAAGVPTFLGLLFSDCMLPEEQRRFRTGIGTLEAQCRDRHHKAFADCTQGQQHALLREWDDAAFGGPRVPESFFRNLKQLVVLGYYTSQAGQVEELQTSMDGGQDQPGGPVMMPPPFKL